MPKLKTLIPDTTVARRNTDVALLRSTDAEFDSRAKMPAPGLRAGRLIRLLAVFLSVLMASLVTTPAVAEVRLALVIGNAHYNNAPTLENPANDASDLSRELTALGFTTKLLVDATKRDFDRAIEQFARDARTADIALFFFAGHGMQFQGRNYVVPVDAELKDEISVAYELTAIDDLKSALQNSKGTKVLVLDSCRDNPLAEKLTRSMHNESRDLAPTRGFAHFEKTSGMIVAYSTQSGETARDGAGRNSPFSTALLKELRTPRLEIGTLFRRVQSDVFEATDGLQEPELSISLVPEFYLNLEDTDQTIWARIRQNPDAGSLQDFLSKFPRSFFAPDAAARLAALNGPAGPQSKLEQAPIISGGQGGAPAAAHDATPPVPSSLTTVSKGSTPSPTSEIDIQKEVRERLYALNFDPGLRDGLFDESARGAVREFERKNNLPVTGVASADLLVRLRNAPVLKPWGAIVFDKAKSKWGMAWGADTRQAAVASARASCGPSNACAVEISFFGAACGAFAHSISSWSIDARENISAATNAALADCRRQGGECQIVASVCAEGNHRFSQAK